MLRILTTLRHNYKTLETHCYFEYLSSSIRTFISLYFHSKCTSSLRQALLLRSKLQGKEVLRSNSYRRKHCKSFLWIPFISFSGFDRIPLDQMISIGVITSTNWKQEEPNTTWETWVVDGYPRGVFKSNFLCVLIEIARIPQAKHSQVDQIMRSHDGDVNSIPSVTCRVWVMAILQKLILNGIVQCSNCDALQQECMRFGNQYSDAAATNDQPQPVVKSRLCH